MAIDPNGNAIATWGSSSGVWANRFVAGNGWGTAQIIGTFSGGYVEWSVQVGVDQNGNAIAHWSHNDANGGSTAWTNRYVAGTGWGTAQTVPGYGQLAVDPSGNAFIFYGLWVARYAAGIGWEISQLLEDGISMTGRSIGVDGGGNAIAVYGQQNPNLILAKRYTVGTGWGSADLVSTDNANYKTETQVSVNNAGNAIAAWFEYAGTDPHTRQTNIWANQFECSTFDDTTPPQVTIAAAPNMLWPPNHRMVNVVVNGSAMDNESGIASVVITVHDEYGVYNMTVPGFGSTIQLEAWRKGTDKDGRVYTVTVVAVDRAGNQSTATTMVTVPHDMRK